MLYFMKNKGNRRKKLFSQLTFIDKGSQNFLRNMVKSRLKSDLILCFLPFFYFFPNWPVILE
jgi:hypothetical protein